MQPKQILVPALLIGIFLILSDCGAPNRIKSSKHLFLDISKMYPLKDYNVVLQTRDSVYLLSNPIVLNNGNMKAEVKDISGSGKKMLFISKNPSKYSVKRILDSTEINPNIIEISKDAISKVVINETRKGSNNQTVYDSNWSTRVALYVLAGIATVIAIIIVVVSLIRATAEAATGAFCYIATMVYGDSHAPEVIVLRKFRDEKLVTTLSGRIFIKIYYLLSPTFVALFRNNEPVNKFIKSILDKLVARLIEKIRK